jgi:hypothetical protein
MTMMDQDGQTHGRRCSDKYMWRFHENSFVLENKIAKIFDIAFGF